MTLQCHNGDIHTVDVLCGCKSDNKSGTAEKTINVCTGIGIFASAIFVRLAQKVLFCQTWNAYVISVETYSWSNPTEGAIVYFP